MPPKAKKTKKQIEEEKSILHPIFIYRKIGRRKKNLRGA